MVTKIGKRRTYVVAGFLKVLSEINCIIFTSKKIFSYLSYLRLDQMPDIFALVDCNNFYVSCERIFKPGLENKPVVVLSNNDGCIIARSDESKNLGIKMGIPVFEISQIIKKNKVIVFSTNYALYGDISERVMNLLSEMAPEIEIYSIDEAFLDLSHIPQTELNETGRKIIEKIRMFTGIPVSIGFGPTKTLAKAANMLAKTSKKNQGVFSLVNNPDAEKIFNKIKINEIWGIGEKYMAFFNRTGIMSAYDLQHANENRIRERLGIVGQRLVLELRGTVCYPLNQNPDVKKEICTSRSFGHPVTSLEELEEATASYVAKAAQKLRKQKSMANSLMLFIMTNKYAKGPQYVNYRIVKLPSPTNQTQELIHFAQIALKRLFRKGYYYKKAGVIVSDVVPSNQVQTSIWEPSTREKNQSILKAVDAINAKTGKEQVKFAIQGNEETWKMRQHNLSPQYTTRWRDILEVNMDH